MDKWWRIAQHNGTPLYGWGTEKEANDYVELLNIGRDVDVYVALECEDGFDPGDDGFDLTDELVS